MLEIFRRRGQGSRWLAAVLLLAWLAPVAVPHADDDLLCSPVSASAEASASVVPATGGEREPHHCVICHNIRSFRTALADCGPVAVALTAQHGIDAPVDATHRAPAFDRLPGRAPPA